MLFIRPILRGRDIKRYGYEFADLWLLYIPWHFPLHLNNNIMGASAEAEKEFEKQYPAVYKYLLTHKEKLSARNKEETGIRYEWYALQRWGANYKDDFFSEKIMYPNMTKYLPFLLDQNGFMLNDKGFILTGQHLYYLTSFFNSSMFKYCYRDCFPELQGGTRELRKIFFNEVFVKKVDDSVNDFFKKILLEIQEKRFSGIDTTCLEKQVDEMIFNIHELSEDEKKTIGFISIC